MKNLLLVFAVCTFLVACNDGSTTKSDVNKDSTTTTVTHDSTVATPSATDTLNKMDTTHKMSVDTTHH